MVSQEGKKPKIGDDVDHENQRYNKSPEDSFKLWKSFQNEEGETGVWQF